MKKTILKERFQQLAGLKPLYTLKESVIDNLIDKTKDVGEDSKEQITSTVKSTILPLAKSNEREITDMVNNNPELSQEIGELEAIKNDLETFLRNYESSSTNEEKGAAAGALSKITAGMASLSSAMWALTGLNGFGKIEYKDTRNWFQRTYDKTKDYTDSALDYVDKTTGGSKYNPFTGASDWMSQVDKSTEWTYGSPTQYAIATASLLAISLAINAIKNAQQTNELTY